MKQFQFNDCGVCSNPDTYTIIDNDKFTLKISVAQDATGINWSNGIQISINYYPFTGNHRGVWDEFLFKTKDEAINNALMDAKTFCNGVMAQCISKYQLAQSQLSLF